MNRRKRLLFFFSLLPFVALAALNSGGYRYGASDQAFYQPAVLAGLDAELFPRDRTLIEAQATLTLMDETIGALARVSGVPLPYLFLVLYVTTLVMLAAAAWSISTRIYTQQWTLFTLLAALTLRHAVARSGTNTLEGYFHPRQLAFAFGAAGVAAVLHGRYAFAAVVVLLAAAVHPTTALWFAVWLVIAALIAERKLRMAAILPGALAVAVAVWALTSGPLAGRLQPMDAEWLSTLAAKDYLFPLAWPPYAWVFNLGTVALAAGLFAVRSRAGLTDARERALALGCLPLLAIFCTALVLHAWNIALAIQLQPARTFWMFDLLATIYVVWAIAEGTSPSPARARVALVFVLLFSSVRGLYALRDLDRPLFQIDIPEDDWGRAMRWARTTDKGSGWLADPMHAVAYGTSVRVAGERDVFTEGVKDAAIGMYDRDVAMRTAERLRELRNFAGLTPDEARSFGARYDLDFLVTEQDLKLPLAFESGTVRVYRLR